MATIEVFAFGSNLPLARLRERAPSAQSLGAAQLAGFRLRLDKRSVDGSGKVNLAREAGASVWGAAFRIERADLATLDDFESGYARIAVPVSLRAGGVCDAQTYLCEQREAGLRAAPWYKALILAGAREHALPGAWIAFLEELPVGDA